MKTSFKILLPLLLLLTLPAAVQAQLNYLTNNGTITITGTSGLVVVVEACTNLATPTWSSVGTNTLTNGSSYFSDSQWTNYAARFYRLCPP
jgi:hypothetical protein